MALDCEMDQNTTGLTLEEIEEDHQRPGLVLKVSLVNMDGEIVLDTLVDYDQEPCQPQVKDHRVIFGRDEPITVDKQQAEKKSERLKAKTKRKAKQQVKENSPPSSIDKGYSTDTAVGSKRLNSKRVSFEQAEAKEMPLIKKRKLDLSSKSMAHIHGIQKELIQDAPTFVEVKKHLCEILSSYESQNGEKPILVGHSLANDIEAM